MKKLIIIRGNSGSGKTTLAKRLQEKFGRNTLLISQDTVRREMLKVLDGADNQALHLLKELLRYGHANNQVTILEGILRADWYGELFELANQLYGDDILAFYYDVSFEETLKRHQSKPNCHEFGEKEMRGLWKGKDYSDLLNETTIAADESLDESVIKILGQINS